MMGTNYYAKVNVCESCGKPEAEIHIGKQSAGWRFAIEIQPEYYNDWTEFEAFIQRADVELCDEYNKSIRFTELLSMIEDKKDKQSRPQDGQRKVVKDEFADLCFYVFS